MIFGSTAIKYFYPDFRDPKDLDLMSEGESKKGKEYHWIEEFDLLIKLSKNKDYLDPDLMLTLKASHANWDVWWDKTMFDILFLKEKGHEINYDIYKTLKKAWKNIHGRESAPLINKSKKDFFNDAVKRIYDHDSIHDAISFYEEPLFHRILKSENSVECSLRKFNKLSFDDQIKLAKEEIYVTALERFIIPEIPGYSLGRAYNDSLKKFVTTMSSGWMSFFLIDNFKFLLYDKFNYKLKLEQNKHKLIKL